MYEGQTIICQTIVEANWLEYLAYVKKRSDEEIERQVKRQKALAELDEEERQIQLSVVNSEKAALAPGLEHYRYYDMSLQNFWSWYVTFKLEAK